MMRSSVAVSLLLAACAADPSSRELELALSAPPEISVPEGHHVVAQHHAQGYQIYECKENAAGTLAWTFRSPVALLTADDGTLLAMHFGGIDAGLPAGPYWQSVLDGSRVHGGNAVASPNPGAIPLLRLQGLDDEGAGIFDGVTFIQRLETTGGVAPTGKCKKKDKAYVPYTAEYVFWAASLPRPVVPDTIVVPEGHDVAMVGHAEGAQVYECAPELVWKLRAPRAVLSDAAGEFADHFGGIEADLPAGPYWESIRDGSRVHGGGALSSPSSGTIPLLRLTALDNAGHGIFSRVSFIQRLATTGGVAPAGACAEVGAQAEVPYSADYYFYVPVD